MSHSPERDIAGAALAALVVLQTPPSAAVKARLADPTTRRIVSYNLAALTQFEWRDAAALTALLAGPGRVIAASTYLFYTTLGRAHFAAGQKTGALAAFTAAVDDPIFAAGPYPLGVPGTRAQLLGILAELTADAGRMEPALKLYDRALAIAPHDGVAARGRCKLLARMGRVDEAARCLGAYLRADPDFLPGHFIRADLLARQGRMREALDSARGGLRITPDEPDARRLVRQLEAAVGGRR
jgi:tetratricopeptide (TPR) repeat protein